MFNINDMILVLKEAGVEANFQSFDQSKSFSDNGIDSLDVFTLLLTLEEKYDFKFSEDESKQLIILDDLINLMSLKGF